MFFITTRTAHSLNWVEYSEKEIWFRTDPEEIRGNEKLKGYYQKKL